MNVKLVMLPLFLTGALLVGCDNATVSNSPDASNAAKVAADAKADANKTAADTKASADKAAANAKADAAKTAADVKTDANKAAADAAHDQASKLLADLSAAVKGQKWTDVGPLIKQLDAVRDNLSAEQKASFDSLKKQYDDRIKP